ncbi:hypothetical protein ABH14_00250 [Brevibacillus brevis]|uniref:helix-turn-helix domain-containing protein n=1 Tax=Brevibacillus brevis TaxID=1393 RepID=UPI001901C198|nr:helix-turn-helix transcriptional regulator [Brevibacillus brevis]MBH0328247.1 hypothetical protein [Brevibacillus brevis]
MNKDSIDFKLSAEEIGEFVLNMRTVAGLTLSQLAGLIKTPEASLRKYEKGQSRPHESRIPGLIERIRNVVKEEIRRNRDGELSYSERNGRGHSRKRRTAKAN